MHSYAGVPDGNPIPAEYAKKLRHGYYACVSYTDAQIGKVLDALEQEGLADKTIIVLWGDHGWQLGDHGLWHKHTNFEIATRAPLMISIPNSSNAGKRCEVPVEFVDVYPTLAEVCGLPAPSNIDGTSLKSYLDNPHAQSEDVAISQYPRYDNVTNKSMMGYSVRSSQWRATFWRERNGANVVATELYDEQSDPHETINVANRPANQSIIESLAKHLPPVLTPSVPTGNQQKDRNRNSKPQPNRNGEDRETRFARFDKNKAGKLTREEYLATQGNAMAGNERFDKWDVNKDGFLTREEFIKMGARQ